MNTFTSILAGIGIGLATSVTGWFLTLLFLAPRVRVEALNPGEENAALPAYQFRIARRGWWGSLSDVQVHCSLCIPHHANLWNALQLKTSTTYFPFVSADLERWVTVFMEPVSLTEDTGQPELKKRLNELNPQKELSDIASLRDVLELIPGSRIEVVVFAGDPLSGARRVSRGLLIPGQEPVTVTDNGGAGK